MMNPKAQPARARPRFRPAWVEGQGKKQLQEQVVAAEPCPAGETGRAHVVSFPPLTREA